MLYQEKTLIFPVRKSDFLFGEVAKKKNLKLQDHPLSKASRFVLVTRGSSQVASVMNNHGDCFRPLRIWLEKPLPNSLYIHGFHFMGVGDPNTEVSVRRDDPPSI